MAVSENDLVVGPLTPAAGVTTISLDFYFEQASWLEVYKAGSETPLVLNVDYTVAGAGSSSGVVTLTTAASGADAYSIYLAVPLQRSSDMQLRGEFKSGPFNVEMDRLWQRLQHHNTLLGRTLQVGRTADIPEPYTPEPETVVGFDAAGGTTLYPVNAATTLNLDPDDVVRRDNAAAVIADTAMGYTSGASVQVSAGQYVLTTAEGFSYEVAASGATDHHVTTAGGVKLYVRGALTTPGAFNVTTGGADRIDQNVMLGGYGDFAQVALPPRPSWGSIAGPEPGSSSHDLELAGHSVGASNDSAVIVGGRPFYYSWVGDNASLSLTYGGDNINTHLAGMNLSMHSDLMQGLALDGVTPKGDHGAIYGGSFHQVAGSYSGSFAGQVKQVFALQSVALGGRNIKIGDLANVDAVRRAGTLGGVNLEMVSGYQSVMLGGDTNTWTAGNNGAIIGGDNNEVDNVEHGLIGVSQWSKVTANRAVVLGSSYAVGDVRNAITRAVGRDVADGDSQTHHIEVRRTMAGPSLYPSVSGGSGVELFTPPANSRGVVRLLLTVQEKQVTSNNGAEYEIKFAWSNIGGTLAILGTPSLTVIYEDDAAWNCAATTSGGGARIAVTVTTNSDTGTYLVTGTGEIVVQTVTAP